LLHLLSVLLNLTPLKIVPFPLLSEFLPFCRGWWPVTLDAPGPLSFPVSIIMPSLPVFSKISVTNWFIVPSVTTPTTVSVISPPPGVYIIIESRNAAIIAPTAVVIPRAIPTAPPWTPPPAIPEKQVYSDPGSNVNIRCIRQHYNIWWCCKLDGRRTGNRIRYAGFLVSYGFRCVGLRAWGGFGYSRLWRGCRCTWWSAGSGFTRWSAGSGCTRWWAWRSFRYAGLRARGRFRYIWGWIVAAHQQH